MCQTECDKAVKEVTQLASNYLLTLWELKQEGERYFDGGFGFIIKASMKRHPLTGNLEAHIELVDLTTNEDNHR